METEFLKKTTPEVVEVIEKCIIKGYEMLDKIRAGYDSRKAVSANPTSAWSEWYRSWVTETLSELGSVYKSRHYLYLFREAKTVRYASSTDLPYSGIEHAIEAKIRVLKDCHSFLMSRSSLTINYNGSINYQVGDHNKNEQS